MGTRLLQKMGWREGQGVGARRRRKAEGDADGEEHWFAPADSKLVSFVRKEGAAGLGWGGVERLEARANEAQQDDDDKAGFDLLARRAKPKKAGGAAFGVGVLNDDGDDDEDHYAIRPKSTYNRTIGGDKKKKVATKHVFVPKKAAALKTALSTRKCHDGRLPLPGFILSDAPVLATIQYPPPVVPEDWNAEPSEPAAAPKRLADPAKLDPRTRGALLGEAPLPGKSVFDFLTPDARNRIANLTGKAHLPPGMGEAPKSATRSTIADLVPPLDPAAARAALTGGFMPAGDVKLFALPQLRNRPSGAPKVEFTSVSDFGARVRQIGRASCRERV